MKMVLRLSILLIIASVTIKDAKAWVYPEHKKIAFLGITQMSPAYRNQLDEIWRKARLGHEARLTPNVIDNNNELKPKQLDFASWSGIAGDHSCSPRNLLFNVLETDWILKVAAIAAKLESDLKNAATLSKKINAIRNSDIQLQRADLDYSNRASANNVHFLLARSSEKDNAKTYLENCLKEGAPLNAIGMYTYYHITALEKARRSSASNISATEQSTLLLSALADEAFADHFLEDIFAAGHVAGIWGSASVRKGTHDYYNEKGLEVVTWNGKRMILTGDAYMREEDGNNVGAIIRESLEQLIDATNGSLPPVIQKTKIRTEDLADNFSVCQEPKMLHLPFEETIAMPILMQTPAPALENGLGAMPRVNSEIGMFFGVSPALDLATISGGFGKDQTSAGVKGGIEANVRLGFGLDGVLNKSGDGLFFLQFGWRQDAASSIKYMNTNSNIATGSITTAIPGRSAFGFRIRMPFYLIPGDLLIASPLFLFSPKTYTKMAVNAGNGGLIPWQSGMATPIGRFQFIIGREMGVTLYGNGFPKDNLLIYDPAMNTTLLLEYRSIQFDFPILEYRPFRFYAQEQSSSLIFQLSAGFDRPLKANVVIPASSNVPELKTVYHLGIRAIFNWRYYL